MALTSDFFSFCDKLLTVLLVTGSLWKKGFIVGKQKDQIMIHLAESRFCRVYESLLFTYIQNYILLGESNPVNVAEK